MNDLKPIVASPGFRWILGVKDLTQAGSMQIDGENSEDSTMLLSD